MNRKSMLDRFLPKVTKTESCWLWNAHRDYKGYGRFWFQGRLGRASRASYFLFVGTLPDDKFILHKCDNTACVRPDHLYAGTNSQNMKDAYARGQKKPTSGESHAFAKLNWNQVRQIRALKGTLTHSDISRNFGVSGSCISAVISGRTWKEPALARKSCP